MPNLEIHIDGRTIVCQTAEDRNLLREADAIAVDPSVVQHLPVAWAEADRSHSRTGG